ncbi:FRIGIDA-like protein 3 [Humulus lupulus]|uniref:FRIGIDA-like protein 3 n=1 Tax=Humulus lupulus TaxID=3486 RepID=UPI002B40BF56|nr:FRIGIDA-like protein 3 [Humulus lupulus]XP_062101874.1 FRIGIDA-like protein 3 [Humulus lupulus]XP_062101875.1 FRIGIDA-like protein 3 [Humulus lupulus]
MAETEQVVTGSSSLLEQLSKVVHELEDHKNASEDRVQWMEIEEHFRNLETTLRMKLEEFECKEKEFIEKEAEIHKSLADRESAVTAKEQDLLDRVQELKDAAVAVIGEAQLNHQRTVSESVDNGDSIITKVSSSLGVTNCPEDLPHKMGKNSEASALDFKPHPELVQFCKQMDAKGLLKYTMENLNKLHVVREELSFALETASEPTRLVLDSLEGFYPPDETNKLGDESLAALQGMHKSCCMFMEAMAALLARADPGADHLLNPETKQHAKAIADEWKPKLTSASTDAANGISLEAEAFLQLLATFRIASDFDEEELCKLVLAVAQHRQAPELCRSLGLTHKVPGLIELLVNSGKQINAVHFIHAFQLTESFPPVPLLKTYLKDLRRNSQGKGENTGVSSGGQEDVNAQELAALKAVIRCVEEYKLEADYPLEPLQKRVAQLERSQTDKKKRGGEHGKRQQTKKQKSSGRFRGYNRPGFAPATGRQGPLYNDRALRAGIPERYPRTDPDAYGYQVPSQAACAQQATDHRLYYYPQDGRVTPSSYNAAPPNYGGYAGSGLLPSNQPYL